MSVARARTGTARSRDVRANHEATTPRLLWWEYGYFLELRNQGESISRPSNEQLISTRSP